MTRSFFPLLRPVNGLPGLAAAAALLAVAALALALAPATASAAAPPYFVGLQDWGTPDATRLLKLNRARVQTYRIQLNWANVEKQKPSGNCNPGSTTCRRQYDWSRYDEVFAQAAKRNIRMLPVLLGSPAWAYAKQTTPPLGPVGRRSYYDFAAAAAKRYGPNGTFWSGRGVPKETRAYYWQVWNEPNLRSYWKERPNPREYASFLSGASDAANRGDSEVRIVVGGLPYSSNRGTIDPREFLRGMFRADPGIYKKFTAVGLHPYARTPSLVAEATRAMRITMNDIGRMGGKYLYLTELGWATGSPDGRFQVRDSTQASYLRDVYSRLIGKRNVWNIKGAIWFSLMDVPNADWWAERTGLLRSSGSEKPSWSSLKSVTGG
jgi:hypothetical protein